MALEDLQYIKEYITVYLGENVTRKILNMIIADIKRLEQFPALGTNLGKNINVPTEYRYLYTEKNYIFNRLESDRIRTPR